MNCQQLPLLIHSTMNSLVDKEDELSTVAMIQSTMNSLVDKEDELSTVATVDSKYYEFISGQGR